MEKKILAVWITWFSLFLAGGQLRAELVGYRTAGWDPPYSAYGISFNGNDQSVQGYMHVAEGRPEVISNRTISPGEWHHIAFVVRQGNPGKSILEVYIDGLMESSREYNGTEVRGHDPTTSLYLGVRREDGGESFSGYIDEAAVFNHPLSREEIGNLYRQGNISFLPGPLQELSGSVPKARDLLQKGDYQEVLSYLPEKIAQYEAWKKQNPEPFKSYIHEVFADLYFMLAQAKEAAWASQEEIAALYQKGIEPGWLTQKNQGPVLAWLYVHMNDEEYQGIIGSLLDHNNDYLAGVIERAGEMMQGQEGQKAVAFLEDNLAAYHQWRQNHPFHEVLVDHRLPLAYYLLAQVRQGADVPEAEKIRAYMDSCAVPVNDYAEEQAQALLWLLAHQHLEECAEIIRSFTASKANEYVCKEIIRKAAQQLEEQKNWEVFQTLLDSLFAQGDRPYEWAVFVESCLQDRTNRWGQQYNRYLEEKPQVRFGRDRALAEQYAAEGNFEKAAALYEDLLKRAGTRADPGELTFQHCKCLFYAGDYQQVLPEIESFISGYKATHRNLVIEAMLLQGGAYAQLNKLDQAIDVYFKTIMEYPEIKDTPKICFLMGYCYMMQNKPQEAAEAFTIVTSLYPDSEYSGKARLCLLRLNNPVRGDSSDGS